MNCLKLCPFGAQFCSKHQRCIRKPPIVAIRNGALKDGLEETDDRRTSRLDKTNEGVDDLFLISVIRVVYLFLFFTVALRRVFPFMVDLITRFSDGLNKIGEQPDASILVVPCNFWMFEDDINYEIQQMR